MKNIWLNRTDLLQANNYIYGDGYNADFYYDVLNANSIPIEGFIRAYSAQKELHGLPIVELKDILGENVNILVTQNKWMDVLDFLSEVVPENNIYTLGNWREGEKCIVCGEKHTIKAGGAFLPFIEARMFAGNRVETAIVHCSKCRVYYSEYRPDDEEMARLYTGYRNREYQEQRQKYEPSYTAEYNEWLSDSSVIMQRKKGIYDYITNFIKDTSNWHTILDFGGDKGQLFPDEWEDKQRIVYEISKPDVCEGIKLVSDYSELSSYLPDLIMCNQVMEHVSDIRGYFANLIKLLKEGGYLYIEVPNERWCVDLEYVRFCEHINFFSEKTFRELAKQFAVELVDVRISNDGLVLRSLFRK